MPWRAGHKGSTAARKSDSGGVPPGYDAGKTEHPTGGAHASVREKEEKAGAGWAAREKGNGPAAENELRERFLGRGKGRGKGGLGRFGLKTSFPIFPFCKRFKQIQVEFKFEEFKFKLNHNIKTMQG